jgi:heme/copper-type cytochrome/quinol oxidase subunit 4
MGKHTARKMNDKKSSSVKSLSLFAIAAIVLTVALYLVCYYFLPPPPPSSSEISVLALIALIAVYLVRFLYMRIRSSKKEPSSR